MYGTEPNHKVDHGALEFSGRPRGREEPCDETASFREREREAFLGELIMR